MIITRKLRVTRILCIVKASLRTPGDILLGNGVGPRKVPDIQSNTS